MQINRNKTTDFLSTQIKPTKAIISPKVIVNEKEEREMTRPSRVPKQYQIFSGVMYRRYCPRRCGFNQQSTQHQLVYLEITPGSMSKYRKADQNHKPYGIGEPYNKHMTIVSLWKNRQRRKPKQRRTTRRLLSRTNMIRY
jgi:hypothetical protein